MTDSEPVPPETTPAPPPATPEVTPPAPPATAPTAAASAASSAAAATSAPGGTAAKPAAAEAIKPPAPKPVPVQPPARPPGAAASAPPPRPSPSASALGSPAAPASQTQPMRSALPVLTAVGFIFVLLAVAWVWNTQMDFGQRLADLAARPIPTPPPSVDPARVATLEARLSGLEQRIAAVENRPVPAPVQVAAPGMTADEAAALSGKLGDLEQRLKEAEQREGGIAQRAALARRLEQAQAALDAGEPLGDVPAAPASVTRFAKAKPPTEAALRLAFPAAAAAAEAASRPSNDGKSLGERILMHASSLVTVKQGGNVLVGAPATVVLGAAQARLEAGDLAGAVATLDGLDSAAAAAMADWRGNAQALLDARAALARMAAG